MNDERPKSLEEMMFKTKDAASITNSKIQSQKKFTPVTSYKPQGNLVYNDELFNKLEHKFN
jgi:phage antirepressor YoqD-like protein